MPSIKLKSSDNVLYTIDMEAIKFLGTIDTMFDCGIEWTEGMVVPITEVNSATLGKVVEWAMHHKDDPEPTQPTKQTKDEILSRITPWDANFLKVDHNTLIELLHAANYLDMKVLLNMVSLAVANTLKDKTPEEIRKNFNIKNDFTPKEEAQARQADDWFEKN